jgi:hypothetical protein
MPRDVFTLGYVYPFWSHLWLAICDVAAKRKCNPLIRSRSDISMAGGERRSDHRLLERRIPLDRDGPFLHALKKYISEHSTARRSEIVQIV